MKIVTLAGGVGGARMARGFAALDTTELTVVVNVGDDDTIYGVDLSPDIDTVVYMLAGLEGQFDPAGAGGRSPRRRGWPSGGAWSPAWKPACARPWPSPCRVRTSSRER